MSYSMPGCGDWSKCVDTNPDVSKDCVKCDKLSKYCASFSCAGFGDVVPKSCAKTCCENGKKIALPDKTDKNKNDKSSSQQPEHKNLLHNIYFLLLVMLIIFVIFFIVMNLKK